MKKISICNKVTQTLCVFTLSTIAHAQTICVYDPMGATGAFANIQKDFVLAMSQQGLKLDIKTFTDEKAVVDLYNTKKCDGISVTGMRARAFNPFVGSLDSIGAVTDFQVAKVATLSFLHPKLSQNMVVGNNEVIGILPVGMAYLFMRDRSIDTMAEMANKKITALDYDDMQPLLIKKVGAKPVTVDINNIGKKFNQGEVDIIAAPSLVYRPFELAKGLGDKGGIVRYPLLTLTLQVIIDRTKFPEGFGATSRTWYSMRVNDTIKIAQRFDQDIPTKYWLNIAAEDKLAYDRILREVRVEMIDRGIYDRKALNMIKKVRCKSNPSSFDCKMDDE